ncbi:unnamed protein product [Bursaphelenchus okinawaensis]|uniref:Uncharacterized protein n=1 Tax=Bursaphelenchus okinawaensis TaxID=465554 RepID=A0A811LPM6_9BILA|nr:unnamed protein product [Bursaphelenchus okinawaensis]CAG9125582.1 unnamed protein product [Bursaphelenchus okinawaensis]
MSSEVAVDRHDLAELRLVDITLPTPMRLLPGLESPLISAVKLALFMMVHSPSGLACVKSCSNALRGSFVSIVGQSEDVDTRLLAPFHAIITKSRTNSVAKRKLAWVCHSMRKFEYCLSSCSESRAKSLQLIKVGQWYTICDASKTYPKSFVDFIGCEKRHHDEVSKMCPHLDVSLTDTLNSFCRKMNDHSECYAKVNFKCESANATNIWKIVNNAIQESYYKILDVSSKDAHLPPECEWAMRNIALTTTTKSTSLLSTPSTTPTTTVTSTQVHEFTVDYWQDVDQSHLYVYEPRSTTGVTTESPTMMPIYANHSPQNASGQKPTTAMCVILLCIIFLSSFW